jgi:pimeloyl-ACP methyl ester carboxylesterase
MDANWERSKDIPAVRLHHADRLPHRLARPGERHDARCGAEAMAGALPDFRGMHLVEGAGHWVQQERPAETNAALLAFLSSV